MSGLGWRLGSGADARDRPHVQQAAWRESLSDQGALAAPPSPTRPLLAPRLIAAVFVLAGGTSSRALTTMNPSGECAVARFPAAGVPAASAGPARPDAASFRRRECPEASRTPGASRRRGTPYGGRACDGPRRASASGARRSGSLAEAPRFRHGGQENPGARRAPGGCVSRSFRDNIARLLRRRGRRGAARRARRHPRAWCACAASLTAKS